MRNRAKCKLCNKIIESLHQHDYIACDCGEISICGGQYRLECGAKNWDNFLRIDEDDREVEVKIVDSLSNKTQEPIEEQQVKKHETNPSQILDEMIKTLENLPAHAMTAPVTHYDYLSLLLLLKRLFNE